MRATPPFDPNATVRNEPIPDVSKWTCNLVGMYESGPLSVRLSYNRRSSYPEGPLDQRREGPGNAPINYTLQGRGNPVSRLDLSTSFNVTDNFTLFFDWTNMLKKPFKSDIVRTNYTDGAPASQRDLPDGRALSRNQSSRAEFDSVSAVASHASRRCRRRSLPPPPPWSSPLRQHHHHHRHLLRLRRQASAARGTQGRQQRAFALPLA